MRQVETSNLKSDEVLQKASQFTTKQQDKINTAFLTFI